ncbi:MAG TPA: hypothetical protein VHH88_02560 [Verrucomicrobiae bacterium]|nr:hypothetical protein [Verrucomicrobiae bacterium]
MSTLPLISHRLYVAAIGGGPAGVERPGKTGNSSPREPACPLAAPLELLDVSRLDYAAAARPARTPAQRPRP